MNMFATRTLLVTLATLVLASCASSPRAPTEISSSATVRYYDIQGTTASELRNELNAKGPKEGGRGFDAYTKWYFRWNWPGYGTRDCDLSAAVVHAYIDVTFPRWSDSTADKSLRKRWLAYVYALAHHENGHVELATKHRETILNAIRASTCEKADEAARQAVQSLNALSADYDRKTRHGRRDGATFP